MNRPRITDDLDAIRKKIDLDGFRLIRIITAVVDCVHQSFPQRRQGIADPTADLRNRVLFLKMMRRQVLQVAQTLPYLVRQRSRKKMFLLCISRFSVGKLHNFNFCATEPGIRIR